MGYVMKKKIYMLNSYTCLFPLSQKNEKRNKTKTTENKYLREDFFIKFEATKMLPKWRKCRSLEALFRHIIY